MRVFLFFLILCSCNSKKPNQIDLALERNDTALVKKIAQKELDRIRASITDSSFGNTIDAMLQIQTLEFTLQKADSSRISNKFAEELILNHPDGQRLYNLMMKTYKHALDLSSKNSDVSYFTNELSQKSQIWLEERFANKKTFEALISLYLLQKDIALISAIENKVDTEFLRNQLETQYNNLINNMLKGY